MWKSVGRFWPLLLFCSTPTFAIGDFQNHLQTLKAKFPYGLIGDDDYDILTLNDLALNACHFKPQPFVPNFIGPYEYWQCFENNTVSTKCEDVGYLDEEGIAGRVVVRARDGQFTREFIENRPWPIRECKSFIKNLKNLMHGTSHVCISAFDISSKVDKAGNQSFFGILGKFKTRKGCEGEECELSAKVKKEYCPDLKI